MVTQEQTSDESRPGAIEVRVFDAGGSRSPVGGANISLFKVSESEERKDLTVKSWKPSKGEFKTTLPTDESGYVKFIVDSAGAYVVTYDHYPETDPKPVYVRSGCIEEVNFNIGCGAEIHLKVKTDDCRETECRHPRVGDLLYATVDFSRDDTCRRYVSMNPLTPGFSLDPDDPFTAWGQIMGPGSQEVKLAIRLPWIGLAGIKASHPTSSGSPPSAASMLLSKGYASFPRVIPQIAGNIGVTHHRSLIDPKETLGLYAWIRNRSKAISFSTKDGESGYGYREFINRVLCIGQGDRCANDSLVLDRQRKELGGYAYGVGAYELMKTATEVFLLCNCLTICRDLKIKHWPADDYVDAGGEASRIGLKVTKQELTDRLCQYLGNNRLPYINRVIETAFPFLRIVDDDEMFCDDVLLRSRVENMCFLELIWNYWHEEGMLVQSINAVSRRFQNMRAPGNRDPLAHMEIDPLRPLNNILWGYIDDERNRLSIPRRTYEYQHHYGLSLYGKAVPDVRAADSRSKFLEAFHNLLNKSADYFRAKQDTQVDPDGYPLLHALQELHLILAQGAHNQFGDLPWTARVEMLMQQWIMARPEMRDFLQSRAMVPYKEEWMPQVDTMKTLQGWTNVTVTHFRDLGVFGEQILLSVRFHNWHAINDEEDAKAWADNWRPEIQGYLHAYRAVSGVDLSNPDTVDYTMPSVHLRKRLALQQRA
jgi:hypothetical protein